MQKSCFQLGTVGGVTRETEAGGSLGYPANSGAAYSYRDPVSENKKKLPHISN